MQSAETDLLEALLVIVAENLSTADRLLKQIQRWAQTLLLQPLTGESDWNWQLTCEAGLPQRLACRNLSNLWKLIGHSTDSLGLFKIRRLLRIP